MSTYPTAPLRNYFLRLYHLLTSIIRDPSGAEHKEVISSSQESSTLDVTDPPQDETATAILKKKKKPNSLMYVKYR